ncbi:hypothetical protein MTYP_02819 [Methylophilaceae bacterium]|nr:hypothetical protein MTYP_02819 [Methylophilaceae bacterium]
MTTTNSISKPKKLMALQVDQRLSLSKSQKKSMTAEPHRLSDIETSYLFCCTYLMFVIFLSSFLLPLTQGYFFIQKQVLSRFL